MHPQTVHLDLPTISVRTSYLRNGIRTIWLTLFHFVANHSSFVGSITLAASLDRQLMYERGYLSGEQAKRKGYNALYGPMCNMMRSPQGGRNPEGYGPEPVSYKADQI